MDTGEDSFLIDGDELTEVEVDENAPIIDDDSSTVFSDNVEEVRLDENENVEEDLHDDSKFTFNGHSDSVYSVAINSMRPGLILTGALSSTISIIILTVPV